MSYNIDSVEYADEKRLSIGRGAANQLYLKHKNYLPEGNVFDDIDPVGHPNDVIEIDKFDWSGCGSGYAYDDCLMDILKQTTGEASLIFTWEGGDSVTGLHVKDGKVTKKNVKMVLE